jgi:ABC-type sugar transport system ATPase subunit
MTAPRVRATGITKAFRGVAVLRGVSLDVHVGEVLGLVGENGAGKSTLMNILGGQITADGGVMQVEGQAYAPQSPADAAAAGIGFVHQEPSLFPNLTIAENLHLRSLPRRRGRPWIDWAAIRRSTTGLLARVGLDRTPDTLVDRLSAGERQLVEIARALAVDARFLMLDEPTSSLGARERAQLLALIDELRSGGLSFLFVSHHLQDVLQTCDRVAVLRDGALVDIHAVAGLEIETLVRQMVGRDSRQIYPARPARTGVSARVPVLAVQGLGAGDVVRDVSFEVRAAEIVGLFGLMGAGRSELARLIFGLDRPDRGEVRLGEAALRGSPARRIARGMALVTEDRRLDGLCLPASIAHNVTLADLRRYASRIGVIARGREREAVERTATSVRLTGARDLTQPVGRLSGGNQQKVVLGKWLLTRPRVLILDEPTRGIDMAARADAYELLAALADAGTALLVISSDLDELVGLCDRLLVLRRGEIAGAFDRGHFDREAILRAALPATVSA